MMERFGIQEVYGMHNMPGRPVGDFAHPPGRRSWPPPTSSPSRSPAAAATPRSRTTPSTRWSPAAQIVLALQSIVARNADPLKAAVVSVTSFRTESDAFNVIPERVELRGTARALDDRRCRT